MNYREKDSSTNLSYGYIKSIIGKKMTAKTHKSKAKYSRKQKHKNVSVF